MKKKNGFLTFLCALVPGAGEMYMGLTHKGAALMLAFCAIIGLWGFFFMGILCIFLPVLWFYSFFDTFNLRAMTEQERRNAAAAFDVKLANLKNHRWKKVFAKRHMLIGIACITIGAFMLINSLIPSELFYEYPWLYSLTRQTPTLIAIILIIVLGVFLIRGGMRTPKSKESEEDIEIYGGKKDA